jgi:hypothetical protein
VLFTICGFAAGAIMAGRKSMDAQAWTDNAADGHFASSGLTIAPGSSSLHTFRTVQIHRSGNSF